jgi:transposase
MYQGSTDATAFEDFVKQLLQYYNKYPDLKSVLVMDNISFHRIAQLQQLCSEAGVKLEYLPSYFLDLNLIEEMFAELKAFIKKQWSIYENNPRQGFYTFLDWCVRIVGSEKKSAEGHFRHAGIEVEDPPAVESPSSQA